ncbi:sulfotransferase [Georgenia alba]|uniref:Sulfotransferase n=1 Tax=Georgenia alba TaxID=2233858 RepID=A0ABW2Q868_9MICO
MGIYILGMHRSGTSAYARTVGRMVGFEESEAEVKRTNARGQWENVPLRHANDRLLKMAGSDWSTPADDLEEVLAAATGDRERAERLRQVHRRLGPEPWVWKDPRNCLTLPAWLAIDPQPAHFTVTVRHPLEVARSLQSRNGFPLLFGAALWERYNRSLIRSLDGRRALFISFNTLLSHPARTIAKTRDWLDRAGYRIVEEDPSDQVDGQLRHSAESDDPDELAAAGLTTAQIDLYRALLTLDGNEHAVDAGEVLSYDESQTTSALLGTRRQMLSISMVIASYKRRLRWARYPGASARRALRRIGARP